MDNMNNTGNRHAGNGRAIRRGNMIFLIVGWIAAIISLIWLPYLLGPIGVVMGILATKNGSKAGLVLIMASLVLTAVGLVFSGVFLNYLSHFMGY